jgi:hypothetical protein
LSVPTDLWNGIALDGPKMAGKAALALLQELRLAAEFRYNSGMRIIFTA